MIKICFTDSSFVIHYFSTMSNLQKQIETLKEKVQNLEDIVKEQQITLRIILEMNLNLVKRINGELPIVSNQKDLEMESLPEEGRSS